ncbi:peptide deformylase [Deinococcus rubellus]|uniref:Peptide deformylase n=1 Tax=Deinococcus rubellus TaxID=1889240 RepID=A0ABY5YH29_9DEIO|nr:peptide deformylase [Deinococcus rubellus]UWX64383.1 peptide deformylase [Deinococcus rubellus]
MPKVLRPHPSVYPLRFYGDPVLRRKANAVTDVTAPVTVPGFESVNLKQVAKSLLETMFEARGVGIAAPQVGLSTRLFVAVEYEDDEEENEGQDKPLRSKMLREFVFVNPVLTVLNKKKDDQMTEGCLSIPNIYEEGVKRNRAVRVDYLDLDGNPRHIEAEDYLARVFQHEIDHLNGVLFLDHLPASITDEYRKELSALQRQAKANLKELEG